MYISLICKTQTLIYLFIYKHRYNITCRKQEKQKDTVAEKINAENGTSYEKEYKANSILVQIVSFLEDG